VLREELIVVAGMTTLINDKREMLVGSNEPT